MHTARNSGSLAAVGLAVAAAAFGTSGCREAVDRTGLQAHRAVAERVAGVMDELQKRRSAMQTESDISEVLAGLRVNAPPPAPAPEPEAPAAETGAAAASDAAAAEAAAGPQAPVVLRLQGIAWSDRAPLAIVNKRTVGVGELVEGFRVERITRNSTVLTGPDGESRELRLYEPVPATP